MNGHRLFSLMILLGGSLALTPGCVRKSSPSVSVAVPARHEHHPPHGGTPVVLGNEAYHLELLLDSASGTLQAYVLDGEMENFIRCDAGTLEIDVQVGGQSKALVLTAVANPAVGDGRGRRPWATAVGDGRGRHGAI